MCRDFGTSLTGVALRWCVSLPAKSIGSFVELRNAFILKFVNDREVARYLNHPYEILGNAASCYETTLNKKEPVRSAAIPKL